MNIFQKQLLLNGVPMVIPAKQERWGAGHPEPPQKVSIEQFERDMKSAKREPCYCLRCGHVTMCLVERALDMWRWQCDCGTVCDEEFVDEPREEDSDYQH